MTELLFEKSRSGLDCEEAKPEQHQVEKQDLRFFLLLRQNVAVVNSEQYASILVYFFLCKVFYEGVNILMSFFCVSATTNFCNKNFSVEPC